MLWCFEHVAFFGVVLTLRLEEGFTYCILFALFCCIIVVHCNNIVILSLFDFVLLLCDFNLFL